MEPRVPGGLAVVVRVDVDEARRHQAAIGVHLAVCVLVDASDGDDSSVGDADVRGALCRTGPVYERPALDHQVEHGFTVLLERGRTVVWVHEGARPRAALFVAGAGCAGARTLCSWRGSAYGGSSLDCAGGSPLPTRGRSVSGRGVGLDRGERGGRAGGAFGADGARFGRARATARVEPQARGRRLRRALVARRARR